MSQPSRQLSWSQRIAAVQHALHTAVRSGDFGFFRVLQAQGLLEGINHVGLLEMSVPHGADTLVMNLDNLNASLAQIFEHAFQTVFTKRKCLVTEASTANPTEARSDLFMDASMQRHIADMAIDRLTHAAISLIEGQPLHVQETAASVWIGGVTIIADCIDICLRHMDTLCQSDGNHDRMEQSWTVVTASVSSSISALKGIYNLMDTTASDSASEASASRTGSVSATSGVSSVFRRLSNALNPATPASSRSSSVAAAKEGSAGPRLSWTIFEALASAGSSSSATSHGSSSMPLKIESHSFQHSTLETIPHTPYDAEVDPLEVYMAEGPKMGGTRDAVMA